MPSPRPAGPTCWTAGAANSAAGNSRADGCLGRARHRHKPPITWPPSPSMPAGSIAGSSSAPPAERERLTTYFAAAAGPAALEQLSELARAGAERLIFQPPGLPGEAPGRNFRRAAVCHWLCQCVVPRHPRSLWSRTGIASGTRRRSKSPQCRTASPTARSPAAGTRTTG